ncbi:hypothetical protein ES708_30892 [subsurface metagenome]
MINHYLKYKSIAGNYNSEEEFLLDIIKEYYIYSNHEGNRVFKILDYILKEIKSKIKKYEDIEISIQILFDKIVDDINLYRQTLFSDVQILQDSFNCLNFNRDILKKSDFTYRLTANGCSNCERDCLNHFIGNYREDIDAILDKLMEEDFIFDISEKEKLIEKLSFLKDLDENVKIDGRNHICWVLTDIFLNLESPSDYFILTTNQAHFQPIAEILGKQVVIP